MALSLNQYASVKLLDHGTGRTNFPIPAVALAVATAAPTPTTSGSTLVEPGTVSAWIGYARQAAGGSSWGAGAIVGSYAQVQNIAQLNLPTLQASSTGVTIAGWALADTTSYGAGNLIWQGAPTSNQPEAVGNTPAVAIGGITIQIGVGGAGASGMGNYLAQKLIDHSTGKTAFTLPTTLYVALMTTASISASQGVEPTSGQWNGYARQACVGAGWGAAAISGGAAQSSNVGALTYPALGSGSTGLTVVGWAVLDSATPGAGNLFWYGQCTNQSFALNNVPSINAGGITLSLS